MSWGVPNRPKISSKIGRPTNREGADGDIQIKGTGLGAKLFAKWSGRWWDVPLSIDGVTKIGVTDSDYLSIDRDSVDIYKNSVKVAEFGSDIALKGGTVIVGEVGASKSNVQITGGAINLRNNTTNKVSLSTAGVLTMGNAEIASDGTATIENLIIDGQIITTGSSRNQMFGRDQNDLGVGNTGIGYQACGDSREASAIYNISIGHSSLQALTTGDYNICIGFNSGINLETGNRNVIIGDSPAAATDTDDTLIISGGQDPSGATTVVTWIKGDSDGNVAFRGQAPAAYDWTVSNKSGTPRDLDANGTLAEIGDRVAQLVDDLISAGILS